MFMGNVWTKKITTKKSILQAPPNSRSLLSIHFGDERYSINVQKSIPQEPPKSPSLLSILVRILASDKSTAEKHTAEGSKLTEQMARVTIIRKVGLKLTKSK
jgi:hypothetical protein